MRAGNVKRMFSCVVAAVMFILACWGTLWPTDVSAAEKAGEKETKASEIAFYVSEDGSDSNAGTAERPFKTIEKARKKVKKINENMTSDIVVYIMEGTYYLNETLTFGSEDSGTNGYKVRYEAFEGAKPIISGGSELKGKWELHDSKNNIYKIAVPDGMDFRQLYMNGKKAVRARSGNPGTFDSSSRILGADRLDAQGNKIPEWWSDQNNAAAKIQADGGRVFVPDDGRISENMDNLKDVELHIFTGWSENILRMGSIHKIDSYNCQAEAVHTGKEFQWNGPAFQIDIRDTEAKRIFNRPHPNLDNYTGGPHYVFYYENAYDFIDQDMEWYLNKETDTLFYKAPKTMDMNAVSAVVPLLEEVISVKGTLDDPVHDIVLKGLTVEHSTWLQPSLEGLVGGQACQYVTYGIFANNNVGVKRAAAGVCIENAAKVRLDGNHIRYMGGTGILLASGTEEVTLINNKVEEIAGNGIEIGKFAVDENTDYHTPYNPKDMREVCRNDRILNNTVHTVGTQYEGAVGIGAGYVQGITIASNTIYDCPYTGISIGYGWTNTPNPMKYNRILKNEIYNVNQIVCDGGAIYTLSNQEPDSCIQENYLHDNLLPADADYGANGIYLDEQTSGYAVSDNVIVSSYGIGQNRTGYNNLQQNHIFEGKSTDAGYDGFLNEKVRSVMDNAGVREHYDENELFEPTISNVDYDPYYQSLYISGVKFGRDKGKVILDTRKGKVTISDERLQSWTDSEIQVQLPENIGIVKNVAVETKGQDTSKLFELELKPNERTNILSEDFDDVPEGALPGTDWSVSVDSKASITALDSGKCMKLKGNAPNLEVYRIGNDGDVLHFGNNITQFDFLFAEQMTGYAGTYNQLRVSKENVIYTADIRPAYFVSLEQKGIGEVMMPDKVIQKGTWYTCRTMVYEDMMYMTIFKKGDTEPSGWEIKKRMDDPVLDDCLLNFSYYDTDGKELYIDHVQVDILQEAEQPNKRVEEIFEDVDNSSWFRDSVQYVFDQEIMTGLTEKLFGPAENLSRAQFATILYRMEGKPEVDFTDNVFPDVVKDQFYTDAAVWANKNKIITGYADKTFGPADHITREQIATMMYRYAEYKKYNTLEKEDLSKFPDHEKVSPFAEKAMEWAVGAGVISGQEFKPGEKVLDPQGNTSRAACSAIIQRFMK